MNDSEISVLSAYTVHIHVQLHYIIYNYITQRTTTLHNVQLHYTMD